MDNSLHGGGQQPGGGRGEDNGSKPEDEGEGDGRGRERVICIRSGYLRSENPTHVISLCLSIDPVGYV